jgi:hypothetical protein
MVAGFIFVRDGEWAGAFFLAKSPSCGLRCKPQFTPKMRFYGKDAFHPKRKKPLLGLFLLERPGRCPGPAIFCKKSSKTFMRLRRGMGERVLGDVGRGWGA